ncbi:putative histone-lysine N-methyltransferase PRDM6 [Exaiptasia diaphana]|uniref:SET domain-containing protein n=1 Tax=Exaiptasia diaphana TaxID=2652724 RepID=A0A913Y6V6_EXADI|nr:putative histone-lysine N-methyltransferase PRDM6 [Exaiptasia diaphana]XP_020916078.1 putative histone-lysine N-methyltransferase PRDM6 [Exaiptasia diaphana]
MDNKPTCKGLGLDNEFILWYLFGSNDVKPVDSCDQHSDIYQEKAISSDQLSDDVSIFHSYAYQSFQPEFQLCWSSIPGNKFGVMASRLIPQDVWIGPYEGKLIDINKEDKCEDRNNMWEILQQNQIRYFIEGTDLSSANWMRFIQCARNKAEQNTSAFQYKGRVYYRVLRDIDIGEEILVWYDDCYQQYMGIPIMEQTNGTKF